MPDERCLLDVGMTQAQIGATAACMKAGHGREARVLLKAQRMALLDRLHACQKQIDCLDYFLQACKEELL